MGAMLVCLAPPTGHGDGEQNAWIPLPTPEAVTEAMRTPRCESPKCTGAHIVAYGKHGHAYIVPMPQPEPRPLAEQLAALYPRPALADVDHWPAPAELNEPLAVQESVSPIAERQKHARLLRDAPLSVEEPAPSPMLADETAPAGVVVPPAPCDVEGCELRQFRQALCEGHYWASLPPLPIFGCSFAGCLRPHVAKGLCSRHYAQQHRGQPLKPLVPKPTAEERFWSKVDKSGSCWLWTGAKSHGYATFVLDGRERHAQYFAWESANGMAVPEGMRLARRPGCPPHCIRAEHWHPETPAQIVAKQIKTRRPRRWKKRPCPSPTPPPLPVPTPTPAEIPYAWLPPSHWKRRWAQKREAS